MAKNWDEIAENVGNATDEHFKNDISSLTRLNDNEIENLILNTGISKQNLISTLKEVQDATKSNAQKAEAIKNITNGVEILTGIVSKLL